MLEMLRVDKFFNPPPPSHTHTHLVNESSYPRQDASHGKVGLPLGVFRQLTQQLKKLLSMLPSTTDIIKETGEERKIAHEERERLLHVHAVHCVADKLKCYPVHTSAPMKN